MKLTDEAVEAAAIAACEHVYPPKTHRRWAAVDDYEQDSWRSTVSVAISAALPHLTDDGAAAPPADPNGTPALTGADQAAESATTTAAPSSPHLADEAKALREEYIRSQVNRRIDFRDGDATAEQIDRWETEAAAWWADRWPALTLIGGAS